MTTLIDTRPDAFDVGALVEPDRVHRSLYTDPRIFDLEMERIWHKTWIYVGHESQVKEPGEYYATTIGKQPVLLTRHSDGKCYVLHNRCAHKGAQLVGDRCGKLKELDAVITAGDLISTESCSAFRWSRAMTTRALTAAGRKRICAARGRKVIAVLSSPA